MKDRTVNRQRFWQEWKQQSTPINKNTGSVSSTACIYANMLTIHILNNLAMTSLRTNLLLVCFFKFLQSGFSQNVTITPDGIAPVLSGSYQRLSYDAIIALPSPNDGDIAYDVTFKCMRLYNGTKWVRLVSDQELNLPSMTGWSAGGTGDDGANGIVLDGIGNIFVSGNFQNTAIFGDTTVTSSGGTDIFIVKYNKNGVVQWVRTAGGSDDDGSQDIAIDSNGNVYIAGGIKGTATFGTASLTSGGNEDIFIAKYNTSGTLVWVQQGIGTGDDMADGIAVDSGDNIYLTGYFNNTVTFGSSSITSAGNMDVFFIKYNSNGVVQWVQRTGSNIIEYGRDIAVDNNGYVYITGYSVGATIIWNNSFPGSGGADVFIAKYNPVTSTWVWSIRGISDGNDSGVSLVTDTSGNLYITGYFDSTFNLYGTVLTSSGLFDTFTAKFTTDGVLVWMRKAGGANYDVGTGIALDIDGNVLVCGYFAETCSFGNTSLVSNGDSDNFIAKYNSAGILQWVQKTGGIGADLALDLAIDGGNNIFMTGVFHNTINLGSAGLSSAGGSDIFVARIKD
jgi:hypothetical protein